MAKNRSENGRFKPKTEEPGSETSKPATDDTKKKATATERAFVALEDILDKAIAARDEDRIVEVSKLLANFKKGSPDEIDPFRERLSFVISKMSPEEKSEVRALIFRAQTIYAVVGIRYGLKPLFAASMSAGDQERILEAAREGRTA